jgi:hypothetical protein
MEASKKDVNLGGAETMWFFDFLIMYPNAHFEGGRGTNHSTSVLDSNPF